MAPRKASVAIYSGLVGNIYRIRYSPQITKNHSIRVVFCIYQHPCHRHPSQYATHVHNVSIVAVFYSHLTTFFSLAKDVCLYKTCAEFFLYNCSVKQANHPKSNCLQGLNTYRTYNNVCIYLTH